MNTLTVSPIQSTCQWQEHGKTCGWPAHWSVNGRPLCAPHLFDLPEEIQAQMQALLDAEARRLQKICRACTDGYGDGICAYHQQKIRTFTRRLKLLTEEREMPAHQVRSRRKAHSLGPARRPVAWCRVCRRRRFVFCTTVRGICCWECFTQAATTNQPTERRPGHGF